MITLLRSEPIRESLNDNIQQVAGAATRCDKTSAICPDWLAGISSVTAGSVKRINVSGTRAPNVGFRLSRHE